MSGGSWSYVYHGIEDAADKLDAERDPLRRAFGKQVRLVAEAMRAIEWVDSGDSAHGSEIDPIKAALGAAAESAEISILIADARDLSSRLQALIEKATA